MLQLGELELELLVKLLTAVGPQLRTDDPTALKEIIVLVNAAAQPSQDDKHAASSANATLAPAKQAPSSARLRVLLDMIVELKNNRQKATRRGTNAQALQRLQKALQFIGNREGSIPLAFKVSWEELKDAERKGRWWLVGSAWEGQQYGATEADSCSRRGGGGRKVANTLLAKAGVEARLLALANAQRMNTELRREIFVAIMGAEDYVDGFERLSKLKLGKAQRAEVSRVLLQCNAQEGTYNGFYALLAAHVCSSHREHRFAMHFALRDLISQVQCTSLAPLKPRAYGLQPAFCSRPPMHTNPLSRPHHCPSAPCAHCNLAFFMGAAPRAASQPCSQHSEAPWPIICEGRYATHVAKGGKLA